MAEYKAVTTQTQVDFEKRIVTGYASIFGNVDRAREIVHPGAFKKTLEGGLGRVSVKYNHKRLLGRPVSAVEDSKGLLTEFYVSKTKFGDDLLVQMDDGSLSTMSFKYEKVKGKFDKSSDGVLNLRELKLHEFGPVDPDLACNPQTMILGVKGVDFIDVWDLIDTLSNYTRELKSTDSLNPETTSDLGRMIARLSEIDQSLKALLEPVPSTPSAESVVPTQSKESAGGGDVSAMLALLTAVRERVTVVRA